MVGQGGKGEELVPPGFGDGEGQQFWIPPAFLFQAQLQNIKFHQRFHDMIPDPRPQGFLLLDRIRAVGCQSAPQAQPVGKSGEFHGLFCG